MLNKLNLLPFVFLLVITLGCASYTLRPVTPEQRAYAALLDFDYAVLGAHQHCRRPSSDYNFCSDLRELAIEGDLISQLLVTAVRADEVNIESLDKLILDLAAITLELENAVE